MSWSRKRHIGYREATSFCLLLWLAGCGGVLVFFFWICGLLQGLKLGMYYLRSCATADAIKFTVDTYVLNMGNATAVDDNAHMAQLVCSLENREECMACGSQVSFAMGF